MKQNEAISLVEASKLALEALETGKPMFDAYWGGNQHDKAITALRTAIEQCGKQEPRGYQLLDTAVFRKKLPENAEPDAWNALYTTPPAEPVQPPPMYGCHIDLDEGQQPDKCVLDGGNPNDCFYARRYGRAAREKCGEWKPIKVLLPSAPVQEPVAWLHTKIEGVAVPHRPADLDKHPDRWVALYKEPKPCPTCEALARTVMMDQTSHDTSPPANANAGKPWVGLTYDDLDDIAVAAKKGNLYDLRLAIEAKLREKNNDY